MKETKPSLMKREFRPPPQPATHTSLTSRSIYDLPWIEKPIRVQCPLDVLHHSHRIEPEFLNQKLLFSQPDAMLALSKNERLLF
jgi:hypothetical protein